MSSGNHRARLPAIDHQTQACFDANPLATRIAIISPQPAIVANVTLYAHAWNLRTVASGVADQNGRSRMPPTRAKRGVPAMSTITAPARAIATLRISSQTRKNSNM